MEVVKTIKEYREAAMALVKSVKDVYIVVKKLDMISPTITNPIPASQYHHRVLVDFSEMANGWS